MSSTTGNKQDINSIKPLIDRIITNPLNFIKSKKNNTKSVSMDDTDGNNSNYIVISKESSKDLNKGKKESSNETVLVKDSNKKKEMKKRPKSLSESLMNYYNTNSSSSNATKSKSNNENKKRKTNEDFELSDNEYVPEDIKLKEETESESDSDEYKSAQDEIIQDYNEDATEVQDENLETKGNTGKREVEEENSKAKGGSEKHEEEEVGEGEEEDNDEDVGEDLEDDVGENLEDDVGEDLEDEVLKNEIDDLRADMETNAQEEKNLKIRTDLKQGHILRVRPSSTATESDDPEKEGSQEGKESTISSSLSSDDKEDSVGTALTKTTLLKQRLVAPDSIKECSTFQINDTKDRGTYEPYRILKNWQLPKNAALYPKGLLNHGVTCYINSAVQAFLHIPAIQNYLNDILNNPANHKKLKKNSVSHQLAESSKKIWNPSIRYYNPKKLINRLEDINCMMSMWEQEDSHEYFMSLMSTLQEDSVPKGEKLKSSIIYDIFGGDFSQKIKCSNCDNVSITEQLFYDLSIDLKKMNKKKDKKFNLKTSIENYFKTEMIHDGYNCETCNKKTTESIKELEVLKYPEVLVIHLKKFKFDGVESSKMKVGVQFDKYMDLSSYTSKKSEMADSASVYQLITVVCHEGRSLSSGHYISHCLQPDMSWATYDDESINKINELDVLNESNAYYLVYSKLTPKVCLQSKIAPKSANKNKSDNNKPPTIKRRSNRNNKNFNKNKKRKL